MILYKAGYKYQLCEAYTVKIELFAQDIDSPYVKLTPNGDLSIIAGYAWDGPSGPAFDSKNFMRGSLVHDALYQLMREGLLDKSHRGIADRILRWHCREDGMSAIRAWWVFRGVSWFAGGAALKKNKRPILEAP